jgi:hypothetical protein
MLCRSARSLAGSVTPPSLTYIRGAKSGPSAMEFIHDSSDDEASSQVTSNISTTQPRPILPRSLDVSLSLVYLKHATCVVSDHIMTKNLRTKVMGNIGINKL